MFTQNDVNFISTHIMRSKKIHHQGAIQATQENEHNRMVTMGKRKNMEKNMTIQWTNE